MKRFIIPVLVLFVVAINAFPGNSEEPAKDRLRIDVLTAAAGSELFARWGHISIVVTDGVRKSRNVYDFGTFDFNHPDPRFRYLMGRLEFWLSTTAYEKKIRYYESQNRRVVSRTLNLTPEQAESLARRLELNAVPENRYYAYRHYYDNCCTRIRNLLNDVLGGIIREKFDAVPAGQSYRFHTADALKRMPVIRNIVLFALGRDADRPATRWDEEFLPEILGRDLDGITVPPHNKPLVARKQVVYGQTETMPGEKRTGWEFWTAFSTLLVLILCFGAYPLLHKKNWSWPRRAAGMGLFLWGAIGGLGGLLIVLLWSLTTHYDSHNNENILVFPFLHLWLMGPGLVLMLKGKLKSKTILHLKRYLVACLVILGATLLLKLGPLFQENYRFIAFAAVLNTASFLMLHLFSKEAADPIHESTQHTAAAH